MKNDRVRSSLIECQSFLNSKIVVDPLYCVLMSFPCFMQLLCTTRYTQFDHIRILVTFVSKINVRGLVVRSGHGPQAEVAQGFGPGPLVEL